MDTGSSLVWFPCTALPLLPSQHPQRRPFPNPHCFVSHGFDDSPVSSELILDLDSRKRRKTPEVKYSPFEKNPNVSNAAFQTYYYVPLRQILVEGNQVKVKAVEDLVGLGPCFNVSGKDTVAVPDLRFKFKGGAEMKLPATSYFVMVDDGVVCLTI
ncbi:hypothetical protein LINPERHAP1_LOCUS37211, partial [Linum perenne]